MRAAPVLIRPTVRVRGVDTSRLGWGESLAAVSGFALFLFMFLPWFGSSSESVSGSGSSNAWQALSFIDILLLIICGLAMLAAVLRVLGAMPTLPWPSGMVILVGGLIAVVLIAFRIIATPVEDAGIFPNETGPRIGIFLALIAAGGIAFGGYTSMAQNAEPTGRRRPRPPDK